MDITVLLFASYRETVGRSRVTVPAEPGLTAEGLFEKLQAEYPSLGDLRPYTTFAVNREVVTPDTELQPGDEVALLQPVSGG